MPTEVNDSTLKPNLSTYQNSQIEILNACFPELMMAWNKKFLLILKCFIISELKILATKRFEARIDAHHKYIANSRLISKPGVHQLNEAFQSIGENISLGTLSRC